MSTKRENGDFESKITEESEAEQNRLISLAIVASMLPKGSPSQKDETAKKLENTKPASRYHAFQEICNAIAPDIKLMQARITNKSDSNKNVPTRVDDDETEDCIKPSILPTQLSSVAIDSDVQSINDASSKVTNDRLTNDSQHAFDKNVLRSEMLKMLPELLIELQGGSLVQTSENIPVNAANTQDDSQTKPDSHRMASKESRKTETETTLTNTTEATQTVPTPSIVPKKISVEIDRLSNNDAEVSMEVQKTPSNENDNDKASKDGTVQEESSVSAVEKESSVDENTRCASLQCSNVSTKSVDLTKETEIISVETSHQEEKELTAKVPRWILHNPLTKSAINLNICQFTPAHVLDETEQDGNDCYKISCLMTFSENKETLLKHEEFKSSFASFENDKVATVSSKTALESLQSLEKALQGLLPARRDLYVSALKDIENLRNINITSTERENGERMNHALLNVNVVGTPNKYTASPIPSQVTLSKSKVPAHNLPVNLDSSFSDPVEKNNLDSPIHDPVAINILDSSKSDISIMELCDDNDDDLVIDEQSNKTHNQEPNKTHNEEPNKINGEEPMKTDIEEPIKTQNVKPIKTQNKELIETHNEKKTVKTPVKEAVRTPVKEKQATINVQTNPPISPTQPAYTDASLTTVSDHSLDTFVIVPVVTNVGDESYKGFNLAEAVLKKGEEKSTPAATIKDGGKKTSCQYCLSKYTPAQMIRHNRIFSKYKCEMCGVRICNKKKLRKHLSAHLDKQHQCFFCFKTFADEAEYTQHLTKHKTRKTQSYHTVKQPTWKCCRSFKNKMMFKRHKLCKHLIKNSTKCHVCNKTFSNESKLSGHMQLHKVIMNECLTCQECFDLEENFLAHECSGKPKLSHIYTLPETEKAIERYKLVQRSCLRFRKIILKHRNRMKSKLHLNEMKDSKSFCVPCLSGFKTRERFYEHLKTCATIKDHGQCMLCKQMFTSLDNLRTHMTSCLKETATRPLHQDIQLQGEEEVKNISTRAVFHCTTCNALFSSSFMFKNHNKLFHSSHTKLACIHCCKLFKSKNLMRKHIRCGKCAFRSIFTCFMCKYKNKSLAMLLEHIDQRHINRKKFNKSLLNSMKKDVRSVKIVDVSGNEKMLTISEEEFQDLKKKDGICVIAGIGKFILRLKNISGECVLEAEQVAEVNPLVFRCCECGNREFSNRNAIFHHFRHEHKMKSIQLSTCRQCRLTFRFKSEKEKHVCDLQNKRSKQLFSSSATVKVKRPPDFISPTKANNDSIPDGEKTNKENTRSIKSPLTKTISKNNKPTSDKTTNEQISKKNVDMKSNGKVASTKPSNENKPTTPVKVTTPVTSSQAPSTPAKVLVFVCLTCTEPFFMAKDCYHVGKCRPKANSVPTEMDAHCTLCTKNFDVADLYKHCLSHTEPRIYECYVCNLKVSKQDTLSKHLRASHNITWDAYHNVWVNSLALHKPQHFLKLIYSKKTSPEYNFRCNRCSKIFYHNETLQFHQKNTCTKPTLDLTKFSLDDPNCAECHMKFPGAKSFLDHCLRNHGIVFKMQCPFCARLCNDTKAIMQHLALDHDINNNNWQMWFIQNTVKVPHLQGANRCACCLSTHSNEIALLKHMFSHIRVMSEQCIVCNESFVSVNELKLHLYRKHNCLFCETCYRLLHSYEDLVAHSQIHVSEVNVPRDPNGKMIIEVQDESECSFVALFPEDHAKQPKFSVSEKVPNKILEDDRLFFCTVCQKCIEGELTFIVHVKMHPMPRQLVCIVCNSKCHDSDQLAEHLKTHFDAQMNLVPTFSKLPQPKDNFEFFKCSVCQEVFDTQSDLQAHNKSPTLTGCLNMYKKATKVSQVTKRYVDERNNTKEATLFDVNVDWQIANVTFDIKRSFTSLKAQWLKDNPSESIEFASNRVISTEPKPLKTKVEKEPKSMSSKTGDSVKTPKEKSPLVSPKAKKSQKETNVKTESAKVNGIAPIIIKKCSKPRNSNLLTVTDFELSPKKTEHNTLVIPTPVSVVKSTKLTNGASPNGVTKKDQVKISLPEFKKKNKYTEVSKKSENVEEIIEPKKKRNVSSVYMKDNKEPAKTLKTQPGPSSVVASKTMLKPAKKPIQVFPQQSVEKVKRSVKSIYMKTPETASLPPALETKELLAVIESVGKRNVKSIYMKSNEDVVKTPGEVVGKRNVKSVYMKADESARTPLKPVNTPSKSNVKQHVVDMKTPEVIQTPTKRNVKSVYMKQQPTENGKKELPAAVEEHLRREENLKTVLMFADGANGNCQLCGWDLLNFDALKVHLLKHLDHPKGEYIGFDNRDFRCVLCPNMVRRSFLKSHLKLKHQKVVDQDGLLKVSVESPNKSANKMVKEDSKIISNLLQNKADHFYGPAPVMPYPFNCSVCGRGFFQRTPYLTHFEKSHPWLHESELNKYPIKRKLKASEQPVAKKRKLEKKNTNETKRKKAIHNIAQKKKDIALKCLEVNKKTKSKITPKLGRKNEIVKKTPDKKNESPKNTVEKKATPKESPKKDVTPRKIVRPGRPPKVFRAVGKKKNEVEVEKKSDTEDEEKVFTPMCLNQSQEEAEVTSMQYSEVPVHSSTPRKEVVEESSSSEIEEETDEEIIESSSEDEQKHEKSEGYICLFCGHALKDTSTLKQHLLSKHKELYTNELEKSDSFRIRKPSVVKAQQQSSVQENSSVQLGSSVSRSTSGRKRVINSNVANFLMESKKAKKVVKKDIQTKKVKPTLKNVSVTTDDTSSEENSSSSSSESSSDDVDVTCKLCDAYVPTSDLRSHKKAHKKNIGKEKVHFNKLNCLVCHTLVERYNLKWHMHMKHAEQKLSTDKTYCKLCNFASRHQRDIDQHLIDAHPETLKIECRLCDQRFPLATLYDTHFEQAHASSIDETNRLCFLCNKTFDTLVLLHRHYSVVHMKKNAELFCDACTKYFYTRDDLDRHRNDFHPTEKFQCGLCMLEFEDIKMCEAHVLVHKRATDHKCHVCMFYFDSQEILEKHAKSHQSAENMETKTTELNKCSECNQTFIREEIYLTHMKNVHGK